MTPLPPNKKEQLRDLLKAAVARGDFDHVAEILCDLAIELPDQADPGG